MKLDAKLLIAGTALAIIVILVIVTALLNSGSPIVEKSSKPLDETFYAQDFIYGPQAWAPYSYGLPIVPGSDPSGGNNFRIMFVDLNVTSRSGGDVVGAGPAVIDYSFKGLNGTAAFHLYGYNQGSGRAVSWRSRPDGSGSTGYYVLGQKSGVTLPNGSHIVNNYDYVEVANIKGPAFNDTGNGTYYLNFATPGKGLNALKLSSVPAGNIGDVTFSNNQSGRFYVTYDSGNGFDDVLLMVAVNGTLSDDFEMHLASGYYQS
jgi:hypothetical protein